jgi:hypothetical protein
VPEYKYTLAFLGYGPEEDNCVIELTYNYGKTEYAKGNAYAQVRVVYGVQDGRGRFAAAAAADLYMCSTNTACGGPKPPHLVSTAIGASVFLYSLGVCTQCRKCFDAIACLHP